MPTQRDKTDALRIIDGMAELLAVPERWTKGWYHDVRNGVECYCLKCAEFIVAGGIDMSHTQRCDALMVTHNAIFATTGVSTFVWNDDPSRTHQDILDLFPKVRLVIEELEVSDAA